MKKAYLILLLLAGQILSFGLKAELVDLGKYTLDTKTGLEWLDLTETKGLSYNDVSAQLATGHPLAGWSYASQKQLNELIANAGYLKKKTAKANNESISSLQILWGITKHRAHKEKGDKSKFLYGTPFLVKIPGRNHYRAYLGSIGKTGQVGKEGGLVLLNNVKSTLATNERREDVGSALVRHR